MRTNPLTIGERTDYCSDSQERSTKETPGSAEDAVSGVRREVYPLRNLHVNSNHRIEPAGGEIPAGAEPVGAEQRDAPRAIAAEDGLTSPGGPSSAGWFDSAMHPSTRKRVIDSLVPTEHWTSLRCWRDSGEEVSTHERLAILRLLYADRGEMIPLDVLFYDPVAAAHWRLPPELCRVPLRAEVEWSYFPPEPSVERARRPAGSALCAPQAPRRGAPNAPAPGRPQGQSSSTYPVAAHGDRSVNATAPGEKTR